MNTENRHKFKTIIKPQLLVKQYKRTWESKHPGLTGGEKHTLHLNNIQRTDEKIHRERVLKTAGAIN